MTLIGLLRHGEAQGGPRFRGSTDDPLTDTGLVQMHAAIDGGRRWDRIITSPLIRCAAFASAVARQRAIPLAFDERIKEMHFGVWEGRTAAQIVSEDSDALTRFWVDPAAHPPPGGEPFARFQARVLSAWNDIVRKYTGQQVLLVTHGGAIRVMLCHTLQRPFAALFDIDVPHGSMHTVRIADTAERIDVR